jgi:hypothetical protein
VEQEVKEIRERGSRKGRVEQEVKEIRERGSRKGRVEQEVKESRERRGIAVKEVIYNVSLCKWILYLQRAQRPYY